VNGFVDRPDQMANNNELNKAAKILLEQNAREAQEKYNSAVRTVGDQYPDYYETGPGQNGWAYFKPRAQGANPQPLTGPNGQSGPKANLSDLKKRFLGPQPLSNPQMTIPMDALQKYAAEKGITTQEALQRFQAKGLNVQ